jgi:hypothetical protein
MDGAILLGGPILILVGAWTVAHPNGGYRAAGGVGSGLSPGARRVAGIVLITVAVVGMVLAVTG